MAKFISGRIKSIRYAVSGAYKLITTEHSIMAQVGFGVLATVLGFVFDISKTEWLFQIFAIGLVISIEGLNTAVEKIADFIHPDFNSKIGFIKDIAAGAVFFAACTAIAIAVVIYIPYFLNC
jgi:diacylglycerol kinase (ATP)